MVYATGTNTPDRALTRLTVEIWRELLRVNLDGAYYITRALLPAMRAAQKGAPYLRLLHFRHVWRRPPAPPTRPPRPACWAWPRAVRVEEKDKGIRTCVVMPGLIRSELPGQAPGEDPRRTARQGSGAGRRGRHHSGCGQAPPPGGRTGTGDPPHPDLSGIPRSAHSTKAPEAVYWLPMRRVTVRFLLLFPLLAGLLPGDIQPGDSRRGEEVFRGPGLCRLPCHQRPGRDRGTRSRPARRPQFHSVAAGRHHVESCPRHVGRHAQAGSGEGHPQPRIGLRPVRLLLLHPLLR